MRDKEEMSQDFGRKVLYNQLRYQAFISGDPLVGWQLEDMRSFSQEKLLKLLQDRGWQLDKTRFIAFAQSVDTPQELLELLLGEEELEPSVEDQLYLVIFELWRRWVSKSQNIEFIIDELSYRILEYERGVAVDSKIERALSDLLALLIKSCENEKESRLLFGYITNACAGDLEHFIYDFILDQLEAGALIYAKELYAAFKPLVQEKVWFDFLHLFWCDRKQAQALFHEIYHQLAKEIDKDLVFEILHYLNNNRLSSLFEKFAALLKNTDLDPEEKMELDELLEDSMLNL